MTASISKTKKGIKFNIRVIPKSSKNMLSVMDEGTIKVKVNAPPVEGKANEACIKYLSGLLGVAKSQVNIVSGFKSKTKVIEVSGDAEVLYDKLCSVIQSA